MEGSRMHMDHMQSGQEKRMKKKQKDWNKKKVQDRRRFD